DLRRVAADGGRAPRGQLVGQCRPHRERADRDGIEHPRRGGGERSGHGFPTRLPLLRGRRPEVDEEPRGGTRERSGLADDVDHRRRRAEREQHVGGEPRHDGVREAVRQRRRSPDLLPQPSRRDGEVEDGFRTHRIAHCDIPSLVRTRS
ncbi:unnamed protein product, partial [Penicillium discolor]